MDYDYNYKGTPIVETDNCSNCGNSDCEHAGYEWDDNNWEWGHICADYKEIELCPGLAKE